jgi:hypothetical protein
MVRVRVKVEVSSNQGCKGCKWEGNVRRVQFFCGTRFLPRTLFSTLGRAFINVQPLVSILGQARGRCPKSVALEGPPSGVYALRQFNRVALRRGQSCSFLMSWEPVASSALYPYKLSARRA